MVWARLADVFGSIKLRLTLAAIAALAIGVVLTTLLLVQRAERDTVAAGVGALLAARQSRCGSEREGRPPSGRQ